MALTGFFLNLSVYAEQKKIFLYLKYLRRSTTKEKIYFVWKEKNFSFKKNFFVEEKNFSEKILYGRKIFFIQKIFLLNFFLAIPSLRFFFSKRVIVPFYQIQ